MISVINHKLVWIAVIAGGLILAGYVEAREKTIQSLKDEEITQAVESALRDDYAVPADDIVVATVKGDVTLTGTVPDLLARDRAERLTTTVMGVRDVKDEIKVTPALRSDSEITADVSSSLGVDPVIAARNLNVKTSGGTVTLSGTVGSSSERARARQLAMSVPGATAVKIDIAIANKKQRPDSAIAADIDEMLRTNVMFRGTALTPEVHNGNVSITGVVISRAQRDQLGDDAWLPGVKSVDVSGIEVDPAAGGPDAPVNTGTAASPAPQKSTQ
jgi:osmotically-inducible protein OsmY